MAKRHHVSDSMEVAKKPCNADDHATARRMGRVGPPPPHTRLYRDAVQSIASFLTLHEKIHMASVQQSWLHDVSTMPADSNNPATTPVCFGCPSQLARGLMSRFSKHLTHVRVPGKAVLNREIAELRRLFAINCPIRTLDLSGSEVSFPVVMVVIDALEHNQAITALNLSNCLYIWQNINGFVNALKKNTRVNTLDLSRNGLGLPEIRSLIATLSSNRTITDLSIAHNQLGTNAIQELATTLGRNRTLRRLDLQGNRITLSAIDSLVRALKTSPALTELILSDNPLGNDSVPYLLDLLRATPTLTALHLHDTGITTPKTELYDVVKRRNGKVGLI